MGFTTKQVHAGVTPDPVTGAILTPIYQSTTFVQESVDQYLSKGYSYSRSGNPTVRALEQKIAVLENGVGCTCYSTGMAAEQVVFQATLSAGDHAIVSDVAYGGTYRLATKIYSRFGVEFSFVDTANPDAVRKAVRANTKLIFTETPANPTLKLTDIAAISKIARERGIPHAVDNTFLTPYLPTAARARRQHLGAQHDEVLRRAQCDDRRRRHLRQRGARSEDALSSERDRRDHVAVRRVAHAARHEDAVAARRAPVGERASDRRVSRAASEGHAGALPGPQELPAARARERAGERFRRDAVVRGRGRRQSRQEAHGLREAVHARREPGFRRDADHASRDDDARRRRAGGAPACRHHRRPRAPVRRASRTSKTWSPTCARRSTSSSRRPRCGYEKANASHASEGGQAPRRQRAGRVARPSDREVHVPDDRGLAERRGEGARFRLHARLEPDDARARASRSGAAGSRRRDRRRAPAWPRSGSRCSAISKRATAS